MKSSKQDKAEGKFHEVKGKVKEVAGKVSDNPELETKEYKMSGKPPFTTLHPVSHDPVGNKAFSLVSPDWAAAHFNEPDLRIIDVGVRAFEGRTCARVRGDRRSPAQYR
jgi:hypothetical protein